MTKEQLNLRLDRDKKWCRESRHKMVQRIRHRETTIWRMMQRLIELKIKRDKIFGVENDEERQRIVQRMVKTKRDKRLMY